MSYYGNKAKAFASHPDAEKRIKWLTWYNRIMLGVSLGLVMAHLLL